jgi:ribonuclease D
MSRNVLAQRESTSTFVNVVDGDLPEAALEVFRRCQLIAWDIETSGLNWAHDRIATCQVYSPSVGAFIVRISDDIPRNLVALLVDAEIIKVFHHAMFDLRFLHYQWSVEAESVLCTKIAAKVLSPLLQDTTLQGLTRDILGIHIDKGERLSNWLSHRLSPRQIDYAASDVIYLPALISELQSRLIESDRWDLAVSCFGFLNSRVRLDIIGAGDVFAYQSSPATEARPIPVSSQP